LKPRPEPTLQATTLWDFPSQNYGEGKQGDTAYAGATPSHVIWNLLLRYTRKKDLVVDPMCGSGTTLDVARDLERRSLGYDLQPQRRDIFKADARKLPLEDQKADFVFFDPPYSTHLEYSGQAECLGELDAHDELYWHAFELVLAEIDRVLKPDRYLAIYVGDSHDPKKGFVPIGARLLVLASRRFAPVDHIAVVRHHRSLERRDWRQQAQRDNTYLRGFHHLFVLKKGDPGDRRDP